MGMEKFYMYAQLYETTKRFERACQQITLLNMKMEDVNRRYDLARQDNMKTFRYSLRMKIMVLEGLLKTYCHYACLKKNEILDLRFKLYGESPDEGETHYNMDYSDSEDEGIAMQTQ